jgi:hypothetical protein
VKPIVCDPATSDRSYDQDEVEFVLAMKSYQESRNRRFPTWTEALAVLKSLGYHK